MRTLSLPHARRLALTAQGLDRPRPARADLRHLRRVLDAVDVVQLDSVNVLVRAHELLFWSRLGAHDRARRDRWLWRSREAYEGWVHVASVTSVDVWPLLHHRRASQPPGRRASALLADDPAYVERVLSEVAATGPVSVQGLADAGVRDGPWWGSPRGKVALDHLTVRGRLAVHDRTPQFVTVYDLAERVIPSRVRDVAAPPAEEARRALLLRAARAHGVGTAADLADHHRLPVPAARRTLADLADDGELEEVRIREWGDEPVYRHPEARAARDVPTRTLMSPFDPVVWFRPRVARLFDFHYRIEIYVPAAKRRHGYYVLPFLLGDRLVARVDLKADRRGGRLLVRGAYAEAGVDRVAVGRGLAAELTDLAAWLSLTDVAVSDRGDLADALDRALG